MFAWGSTVHGQLGLGGTEEEQIVTPTQLEWHEATKVTKAAVGESHTLFLTDDCRVHSCGCNDYGQLGHEQPRKRPQYIGGLEAHRIVDIACGASHSLALNEWGQVFAWGSDSSGQLGHELGQTFQPVPKIIKSLAQYRIVQIAAGQRHSLALSINGHVLVWGANDYGQLGIGKVSRFEDRISIIKSLRGIPIAYIACGNSHSFCVSKSGAVFGWGKNTSGQLGLNNIENKCFPTQLRTLRNIKVRYISCGDDFSMFLTLDGGVFSCGCGSCGQLGHGTTSSELIPKQILELMGSTITQICCGRQHSLAFVPSRGLVYSFGLGGSGQLGIRETTNASTPQLVLGPWVSSSGTQLVPSATKSNQSIRKVFAGGDQCFALCANQDLRLTPDDYRAYDPHTQIITIGDRMITACIDLKTDSRVDDDLLSDLEWGFRSLACFNGSFLLPNNEHYYCTSKRHGVDIAVAERTFDMIGKIENSTIKDLIWNCITEDLLKSLMDSPPDVETLRVYVTLPFYHEFHNPKQFLKLHAPFAFAIKALDTQACRVLGQWWTMLPTNYFERLVTTFKLTVCFMLRSQQIPFQEKVQDDPKLQAILDLLNVLNDLNNQVDGLKVSHDCFHITDLEDILDIRTDYVLWLSTVHNAGTVYLCNYPFIFDTQVKTRLLETDQAIQMQTAMQNAQHQALMAQLLLPHLNQGVVDVLYLTVSREHIVADAIRELSAVKDKDLKKPLKVKFIDEEGEDAGGVRKEFFMLLLREILDPKYGMFKQYEETNSIWFAEYPFEDLNVFYLIGLICGLAIYNFTIINIPFPLVLYKKLLNQPVDLKDLRQLSPTIANSLQQLLDYNNDDFEDVFELTFEITRDVYGEMKSIELQSNGASTKVTQTNKKDYVSKYTEFVLNKSVAKQFEAFQNGFMRVCGGRVLQLFDAHELMAVVIGNENYDWQVFEENAIYKSGYHSADPTIKLFWSVFHELSESNKRKFLLFLTGTDRIPIRGMKEIRIVIQPTADDKYLPVAHTCFNLLDLPRYSTKERLKYKLLQAIQCTEGFTIV